MPNTKILKDKGQEFYPITHVSCVVGMENNGRMNATYAWDGTDTPDVSKIPSGVVVTYNGTTYTGTLAASASTTGMFYLVPSTTVTGEWDRYITEVSGSSFAWKAAGNTAIPSPTIADNLTTDDANTALSAKQGKVLDGKVSQLRQEVTADVSQLEAKVTDIDGTLNGESEVITETVTLATIQTLTTSGLLKDDGVTVQASGAGIHSDFISLEGIDGDLSVTGWASNNKIVFFYDSTKTFLSYALSGKKLAEPVQIPPTAAYIRVNGLTASYLSGQGASEYATNITGTKTTIIQSGGLVADVEDLQETTESLGETVSDNTERIEALEGKTSDAVTKYIHFSFDDAYRILKYLYTDSPESIFEEQRMALCKQLHEEYGAVFSFYLFNDEINPQTEEVLWSIESTPSTYKAQFEACSDWIKFGYHTKNRNSNAGNFTVSELTADYARTIAVIQNCIGMESLDRCPRLGGYNGSLDRVLALRDAPAGIIGLLGPDDTRQGYYMTNSQAAFLHSHDRWTDAENQLTFVATDLRLESSDVVDSIDTVIASWETSAKWNIVRELVLFTHEGVVFVAGNNIPSNMEAICQWAVQKGYKFDFPQNHIW